MKPSFLTRAFALLLCAMLISLINQAQSIGSFSSVNPNGRNQTLVLPSGTHTFQRIIKSGDALSLGGNLGINLDFTGYIPISGSSKNGRLSISSEDVVAEVAVLDVNYTSTNHIWNVTAGGKVNFNPTEIGTVRRFCSGTVTPNGTVIVSEEDLTSGNVNSGVDGYTDAGWLIEFNPATRTVINQAGDNPAADKLWALGRANRENAVVRNDNMVLYTGADNSTNGYLFKFVPTVPGVFSAGSLYVLRTTAALGTGTWKLVPNSTVAERHNLLTNSAAAPAAYNFNGVEDVEIGPDGKIYFTAKNEGKVYRFTDNGTVGTGTDVTNLEIFVGNSSAGITYDVDGAGGFAAESWGTGNDNLAFDGDGNLWVLQDGGEGHIWVVAPAHTQASPQVRLFATTPVGSEPTGITFSPDYNFMFISFQHPTGTNTTSVTDAAGNAVIFNTHTTVVIGRISVLGPLATLPVKFTNFDARLAGEGVAINWTVTEINNHSYFAVERSVNGTDFTEIHRNTDDLTGVTSRSFSINDNNLPDAAVLYYRIKQCDQNGGCKYTEVKTVKPGQARIARLFPQPALDQLNVQYYSGAEGTGVITITNVNGQTLSKETRRFSKGIQTLALKTNQLPGGFYLLTIKGIDDQPVTQRFVKE